jgi:hypothetical protein
MAKRQTKKEEVAKSKVNSLLKDVLPKKEKEVDVIEEVEQKKGNEWLEEQVDALTKENEQLKIDLQKAFADINKIRESGGSVEADELKAGIVKIFKDLEDNLLGRNPNRTQYLKADIKILLNKFLATFPFMMKK